MCVFPAAVDPSAVPPAVRAAAPAAASPSHLGPPNSAGLADRGRSRAAAKPRPMGSRLAASARRAGGWLAAVTLALTFTVSVAQACNVPVFRFALERWRADAYRVTVVNRGPLGPDERSALERLEKCQSEASSNLQVRVLDAERSDDPADRELLESLGDAALPMMIVQYPEALRIPLPIWGGRFTLANVERFLESPLRGQLLERLLAGETAIWLLLESSDAAKNDAAAALLDQELKKLAASLKLPELTDLPDDTLFAKTPLKLAFSTLRVPRSESEGPLVQMLLRSESDLLERDDPMVFPVFGRGRALLPLVGAGITAENIANSAKFLVGACSCEVKELNPGFDLLITAQWEQLLAIDGQPLPIVSKRQAGDDAAASRSNAPPELVPIPAGSGNAANGNANNSNTANGNAANSNTDNSNTDNSNENNSNADKSNADNGNKAAGPSVPPLPTAKLVLLGVGGLGLLLTLARVVRSQQAASRCRKP